MIKKTMLFLLISAISTWAYAQCLPVFKVFSPWPGRNGLSGTYNLSERFRSPYNYYMVAYEDGNFSNPGLTRMNLWNGKQWDTATIPFGTRYFLVYDSTYYVSCKLSEFKGIKAPAGKLFTMLRLKNGSWDTVPGATLDTGIANYTGEYVSNPSGIYFNTEKSKTKLGSVYKYSKNLNKCSKIIDYERVLYAVDLIASPKRILLAKVGKVNGKSCSGFTYIDSSGIHVVSNSNFDPTMIYGVDVNSDEIYAFDYAANPDVRVFTDKLIRRYSTTVPNSSSNGDAQIIDGKIIWVGYDYSQNVTLVKVLCPGETRWKVMAIGQSNGPGIYNVNVTQQGVFAIGRGTIYALGNGSSVYGQAFVDADSNCLKDSADQLIGNRLISLSNSRMTYAGLLDDDGKFEVFVLPDTYQISGPYDLSKCMKSKVSPTTSGKSYNHDVALRKPGFHDLWVKNYSFGDVRWNAEASFFLELENIGEPADSAHFTITLDPKLNIQSSDPQIDSIKNNLAFGKVYHLKYFDKRKIKFYAWVDTANTKPDSVLCHKMQGYLYVAEKDSNNNSTSNCQKIVYSFDPNRISVDKKEIPPFNKESLFYRIDFENEGSDDAHDVTVVDTLSSLLKPGKIEILSASHPFSFNAEGKSLNFYFKDIFLRPKMKDSVLSKGYIIFKTETLGDLTDGAFIANKAYIYFDLNKPVITNTAVTKINLMEAGIQKNNQNKLALKIYPNPVNETLNVGPEMAKREVRIFTIQGAQIYQGLQKSNEVLQISTQHWGAGVYIVQAGNSTARVMVVK